MSGPQLACASCHRRSGMGSSEGSIVIPPVAGKVLYRPRTIARKELYQKRFEGQGTRPAYTEETLARAIRAGIDAGGRPLRPLMPRYRLDEHAMALLIAYLKGLSSSFSPGVTKDTLHFATVVDGRVPQGAQEAMLAMMRAYVRDKNAETRWETRRAATPPWHRDWIYQAYRKWDFHVWMLRGPPGGWQAQLEAYYQKQPVFAIIGGLGAGSWEPVHRFCEANAIPCLFPDTPLPFVEEKSFYTRYLSKGLWLEAALLRGHLKAHPVEGPVVQVYEPGTPGEIVARSLRDTEGYAMVREVPAKAGATVLWLERPPLEEISPDTRVYLSSTLLGEEPPPVAGNVYRLHPFELPDRMEARLFRVKLWLKRRDLALTHPRLQADTYFALTMVRGLVRHLVDNFYRDYFVELLEHMVDNAVVTGSYPSVSLGPGQHFASKGGYVLKCCEDKSWVPEGGYIVPE